ncbi:rhodanese-like domain-containing protein [Sporolituus thermophilus]|uniref:Rhodanese-related sulfurtransferase n=1 Tax=Sporolituus thermophilus DSM 23256 TaxID=1123285 RepID=A0A1G7P380_9FIRM|nr:rhodanese-like domain-containing protein [Sporolituus thermophilus]SDF80567.1 Rhodanese-related sulfurtransferase [Sporolituus thermophilus DSM 23256]
MTTKTKLAVLAILLILTLLTTACGGATSSPLQQPAPAVDVTPEEALNAWQGKSAVILDVRTPDEFAQGHIPGAVLIPLDQLDKRLDEVPKDKKVLVICRSGNRSSQATKLLRNNGFTNVYNVLGGMNHWPGPVEK